MSSRMQENIRKLTLSDFLEQQIIQAFKIKVTRNPAKTILTLEYEDGCKSYVVLRKSYP